MADDLFALSGDVLVLIGFRDKYSSRIVFDDEFFGFWLFEEAGLGCLDGGRVGAGEDCMTKAGTYFHWLGENCRQQFPWEDEVRNRP